jgi:hypothetical protein
LRRVAALLALTMLASCGQTDQGTVEGLVIDVQGDLSAVTAFSVLTEDGTEVFVPATDGDFAFPLQHLREHILSGIPVVVFWEIRDGVKFAVLVDDAGESAH